MEVPMMKKGYFLVFITFLIIFSGALKTHAGIILNHPTYTGLNKGLVCYWSFDGKDMAGVKAYDRSGQGNDGTLTNGPASAIGRIGQGLSFNGTNYVNTSEVPFNFGTSDFAVGAWVKSSTAYAGTKFPFGHFSASLVWASSLNTSIFGFSVYGSLGNIGSNKSFNAVDTNWHHLVGVITRSGNNATITLYADGISLGSDSGTVGNITAPNPFQIGTWDGDTANGFKGTIDDVRIYNRALSADEIKRLYKIGATLKINTSINNDSLQKGLVGYWSFEGKDMAGNTAYDRSGNANNGTLTGVDGSTDTIAVDGTPSTGTFTTGNPINVSHTTGSGATFMLVVISITNDNFGSISSVTYNGDALTQACENQSDDDANVYIYYRVNPDITTANVTVTLSTGAASGGVIGVMTFSGVNTTTPLGTCAD